jgi:deoxycytidylate deaminase
MSMKKENLKERIEQRKTEAEEIQKVHEQLQALRAIHKEENAAFAAQRSSLIFKEEIQSQPENTKK